MHIYVIYQITNLISGKIYIGAHKTTDPHDNYMGSGRAITNAIKKYGRDNFTKEILYTFISEREMYEKEAEIVTEEFCHRADNYNIRVGGIGGFNHINNDPDERARVTELSRIKNKNKRRHIPTAEERLATSERNKLNLRLGIGPYSVDAKEKAAEFKRSQAHRDHMREIMRGERNVMHGSAFYLDTLTNEKKRFMKGDPIPDGWVKLTNYRESRMIKNWYHDGVKNYLIDKDSHLIHELNLTRGRI